MKSFTCQKPDFKYEISCSPKFLARGVHDVLPFFVDDYTEYGFQTFEKIVESRKDVFKNIKTAGIYCKSSKNQYNWQ